MGIAARLPSPPLTVEEPTAGELQVSPGFESVGEAFTRNFTQRRELGGACCIYLDAEKVVESLL